MKTSQKLSGGSTRYSKERFEIMRKAINDKSYQGSTSKQEIVTYPDVVIAKRMATCRH